MKQMKEIIVAYPEHGEKADNGCIMGEWVSELVRCRDCIHWDEFSESCDGMSGIKKADWFCAYGVKRE